MTDIPEVHEDEAGLVVFKHVKVFAHDDANAESAIETEAEKLRTRMGEMAAEVERLTTNSENWLYYQELLKSNGFSGITDLLTKFREQERENDRLKSVIDAQQSPAVAVPDGWKLVPIVLTDEMVEAFNIAEDSFQDGRGTAPDCHWAAMISAAPLPTSGQSPRMTEQDAREIAISVLKFTGWKNKTEINFSDWFNGWGGRALLDKLNGVTNAQ